MDGDVHKIIKFDLSEEEGTISHRPTQTFSSADLAEEKLSSLARKSTPTQYYHAGKGAKAAELDGYAPAQSDFPGPSLPISAQGLPASGGLTRLQCGGLFSVTSLLHFTDLALEPFSVTRVSHRVDRVHGGKHGHKEIAVGKMGTSINK